jgi:hypothetical protein
VNDDEAQPHNALNQPFERRAGSILASGTTKRESDLEWEAP